jgi:hypothetical protein
MEFYEKYCREVKGLRPPPGTIRRVALPRRLHPL